MIPINQVNPTIVIRIFDGDDAYSVYLTDNDLCDEYGDKLSSEQVDNLSILFSKYEGSGEEYDMVKKILK